jgi:hypothetical protein
MKPERQALLAKLEEWRQKVERGEIESIHAMLFLGEDDIEVEIGGEPQGVKKLFRAQEAMLEFVHNAATDSLDAALDAAAKALAINKVLGHSTDGSN